MNQPAAPAWTMRGKKCTIDQLNDGYVDSSPGPVYNMHGTGIKTKVLSYTTGKSHRTVINQGTPNNPSPSHYQPNNPSLLTHSVSFPKNNKVVESDTVPFPDPGAYQFDPNLIKETYPNYSMGSKYPCFTENTGKNPGPADYSNNPEVFLSSQATKNSRFGTQKRFSTPNLLVPGPGDYNISTQLVKDKLALTQSRRSLDIKITPGPGDYKHFDQFLHNDQKGIGKTLSKKLESCFNTQSNTAEAFNNYFKDEKKPGRSWTVGKQKRQVFNGNETPAPTDYKVNTDQVVKDGVKVGFAKSSWIEHNSAVFNPGPGHYKDQQFGVTTYTIPKSKSLDNFNKNPGAGRYNIDSGMGTYRQKFPNQGAGNLIGKALRTNFVSRNKAGVGDYDLIKKKTSGISIPKANRFPKPNNNPGPGDYHMSSTISNFNMYRKRN